MLRVFTSSCQSGFLCLCVHLSQHIPRLRNESLGRLSQFLYDRWPVRLPPLHWLYHPPLAILGEVDRSLRRQWKEFDVEIWFHSDISLRSEVLWHSVRHLHLCWLTICISSCNKMPAAKGKSPRFWRSNGFGTGGPRISFLLCKTSTGQPLHQLQVW